MWTLVGWGHAQVRRWIRWPQDEWSWRGSWSTVDELFAGRVLGRADRAMEGLQGGGCLELWDGGVEGWWP
jgi:hypothetical protein